MRYRGLRYRHTRGAGGVAPSGTHPRFFVTASGVSPTLAEKQAELAGSLAGPFQAFVNYFCKNEANGGVLDTTATDGYGPEDALIYAFLLMTYPVGGSITYGDVSAVGQLSAVALAHYDVQVAGIPGDNTPERAIRTSWVYDWIYDYLSSARKQAFVTAYRNLVNTTFSAGILHHVGARQANWYVMGGYAWDGDTGIGAGDLTDATTRKAARSTYITGNGGTQTALNLLNGAYNEGYGYFMSEWQQGLGFIDWAAHDCYRSAASVTGEFNAGNLKAHEYFPLWTAHMLAPYRASISGFPYYVLLKGPQTVETLADATTGSPDTTQNTNAYLKLLGRAYASVNATQAALGQWLMQNVTGWTDGLVPAPPAVSSQTYRRWALFTNFIGNNSVSATSPAGLNLDPFKHFDPLGDVCIRDSWTFDGTSSLVKFVARPYYYSTNQYDNATPGHFSIHRRGPLVIEPGNGAHGEYQENGWGGNTIIFPKPAETRSGRTYWDKGGMRPPSNVTPVTDATALFPNSTWDIGGLKTGTGRVDLTDGTAAHVYSYLYADLTRAYNSDTVADSENSSKISNFERQFVRFPPTIPGNTPGYTVIYDRTTTTSTAVEQRWLLHPAAHMTNTTKTMAISAYDSLVANGTTRNSIQSDHYLGTGGTVIGTISYSGNNGLSAKAYWSPLLPASCKIIERGGPNGSNQSYRVDSHEWEDPYGVQAGTFDTDTVGGHGFYSSSGTNLPPWQGSYRYELLAQTTTQVQPFLNVIEDVETSASSRTSLVTISGTNTTGVQIGTQWAVIFKTTTGTLSSGDFQLTLAGTFDVLLTDVPASTALTFVKGGGGSSNITSITHIATSDTDLTYTSTSTRTIWLRIVVSTNGTGTNNTVSFS